MGNVLVVDDEEKIREALARLLEADGHVVRQASDGCQALEMIGRELPDVLLLDILMPVMDGYEVLKDLRADAATAELPVVVITVLGRPADRDRADRLGVVDYVLKPWMPGEIELRVKWALKAGRKVPAVPWHMSGATGEFSNSLAHAGSAARSSSVGASAPGGAAGARVDVVTPDAGGAVETDDGVVRVDVPAGAVRNPMALDASPATSAEPAGASTLRIKMGGAVADLTFSDRTGTPVEGVQLDKPVKISIKYSDEDVAEAGDEDGLTIQKYNGQTGDWVGLPTTVDRARRTTVTRQRRWPGPTEGGRQLGKVLVVEDEDSARMPLVDAMESSGYEVIEESDGGRVAALVIKERPDVVLLDLTLPRLDGFQVLRQLKGDPATRSTSVIMMSEAEDADEFATSMTLGARDYVAKPWHIGDLQHRVRRAFEASRARMRQAERAVARAKTRLTRRRAGRKAPATRRAS